jgi:hypothetical protein
VDSVRTLPVSVKGSESRTRLEILAASVRVTLSCWVTRAGPGALEELTVVTVLSAVPSLADRDGHRDRHG